MVGCGFERLAASATARSNAVGGLKNAIRKV
jgi:hypothetical protein